MSKVNNKNRIGARIFRFIVFFAFALFIGISIYIFNARVMLHEPYPTIGGYGWSLVISGSMEPTININDVVVTKEQNSYDVDDVITYVDENGQSMVIHRVVDINSSGKYITKGDANNASDKPVDASRVRGKLIAVLPGCGFIFSSVFIYILGGIIVALLILSFINEAKQRKEDKIRENQLRQEINY